jgi:hypothetical protein
VGRGGGRRSSKASEASKQRQQQRRACPACGRARILYSNGTSVDTTWVYWEGEENGLRSYEES